jgi:hypothetical protein
MSAAEKAKAALQSINRGDYQQAAQFYAEAVAESPASRVKPPSEGLEAHRLPRYTLPHLGWHVAVRRHNIVEKEIPAAIPFIAVEDPGHAPPFAGAAVALDEFLTRPAASDFLPIYRESG